MAAVGRVALALLALGHTEMAISSALCDSAMGQFCSDKRGTGGACTSCLGTFTHQSLLHVAGCTSDELTAYCRPGLQRPQRLVVYHVYPAPEKGQHSWQDTSIANKNTADLPGMIYFELRALGLPVECLEQSIVVPIPGSKPLITPDPSAVFDCTNQETNASSPLRLSQIELLVDSNYGDYAFCNLCYQGYDPYGHGPSSLSPTRCNQGEYVCDCQHRGFGPATCNGVVGNLDVAGFFTIIQPVQQVDWRWWSYNAARLTAGNWYSTLAGDACPAPGAPAPTGPCAWQTTRTVATVDKACHQAAWLSSIETWGRSHNRDSCMTGCGTAGHRNTSAPCYINCVFDMLLGAGSSNLQTPVNSGIDIGTLSSLWTQAFAACPKLLPG